MNGLIVILIECYLYGWLSLLPMYFLSSIMVTSTQVWGLTYKKSLFIRHIFARYFIFVFLFHFSLINKSKVRSVEQVTKTCGAKILILFKFALEKFKNCWLNCFKDALRCFQKILGSGVKDTEVAGVWFNCVFPLCVMHMTGDISIAVNEWSTMVVVNEDICICTKYEKKNHMEK